MRWIFVSIGCTLLICGCAGLEFAQTPDIPRPKSQVSGPGFKTYESLHFVVKGRDLNLLRSVSEISEKIYQDIMSDTNLFSFKPKESYVIMVYRDRNEYHYETGYPLWSGGATTTLLLGQILPQERDVRAKTTIYTAKDIYETLGPPLLAHEISHLIFNEYMEFYDDRDADRVRWLNEGLASYEELKSNASWKGVDILERIRPLLKQHAYPLETVIQFNPFNHSPEHLGSFGIGGRTMIYTNVDIWYWQVRDIVKFLIEKEGRYSFFLFMKALKDKMGLTASLHNAYSGKWRDIRELETEWKNSLGP